MRFENKPCKEKTSNARKLFCDSKHAAKHNVINAEFRKKKGRPGREKGRLAGREK